MSLWKKRPARDAIGSAILEQLPLSNINSVIFYKRDEITTDLICCELEADGKVWTFHEEADGWADLLRHLEALPDFRKDWFEAVSQPPFAVSETVAFKRTISDCKSTA
ncbi:hypothetical protein BH11PSE2_BH11PSE2_20010 [soil metagenome]